jgi:hypothetical protein
VFLIDSLSEQADPPAEVNFEAKVSKIFWILFKSAAFTPAGLA